MTRGNWIILFSALVSIVITQVILWLRGIKPARKISLWEHLLWERFPQDRQTKEYYLQRLLTTIFVLPVTVLALFVLASFLDW